MNRFQKLVLGLALANMVVLALFPPYNVESVLRGAAVFDAFHPVFSPPPNGLINANLLYVALFGVFANAALAWLLLSSGKDGRPRVDPGNLVVILTFVNMMLVFLFPPFETAPVAGRFGGGSFDGFQFALGGTERRSIFLPLLTIEVMFVLLNACVAWLVLRERTAAAVMDESLGQMISEDERMKAEIDARVKQGVEDRIKEEAKAAGRAAASRGKSN